jgi:hypothetical protein
MRVVWLHFRVLFVCNSCRPRFHICLSLVRCGWILEVDRFRLLHWSSEVPLRHLSCAFYSLKQLGNICFSFGWDRMLQPLNICYSCLVFYVNFLCRFAWNHPDIIICLKTNTLLTVAKVRFLRWRLWCWSLFQNSFLRSTQVFFRGSLHNLSF